VKVRTRKLAVFVTCLGLAAAFPVLSSADKGGVPNSHSKPCKLHKAKKKPMKPKPNNKGKKCGFNRAPSLTTVAPTTGGPTGPSGTQTETETQTTTTTSSTTTGI
jgi:hypothetical protein